MSPNSDRHGDDQSLSLTLLRPIIEKQILIVIYHDIRIRKNAQLTGYCVQIARYAYTGDQLAERSLDPRFSQHSTVFGRKFIL